MKEGYGSLQTRLLKKRIAMIINKELAQSKGCEQKDKWETPETVFIPLNKEFGFTLDPCCEPHTAKCQKFYTEDQNGLDKDWTGEVVFCNPPYSRGNIDKWMKKCFEEGKKGVTVVALIPVSTSSAWWHEYVWKKAEIRFIKGRVRFRGAPFTAPFSSCLAIFK
jgi:phage N-6-adenine-methyltransferase